VVTARVSTQAAASFFFHGSETYLVSNNNFFHFGGTQTSKSRVRQMRCNFLYSLEQLIHLEFKQNFHFGGPQTSKWSLAFIWYWHLKKRKGRVWANQGEVPSDVRST
jgi:hypothetical protein